MDSRPDAGQGRGQKINNNHARAVAIEATTVGGKILSDYYQHQPLTVQVRQELSRCCRRALDTWSPALDWCLVASGRADLVVALAGGPIVPNASTLILEEVGGTITDLSGQAFTGQDASILIGSNGTTLHEQCLQLLMQLQQAPEEGVSWQGPFPSRTRSLLISPAITEHS